MDDAFEVTEVQQVGEKTTMVSTIQPEMEKFVQESEQVTAFQVSQKILHDLLKQRVLQNFTLEDRLKQLPDEYRREKRSFYLKLLVAMDSFDRILELADPQNNLITDVEMLRDEFCSVLAEVEIHPIELQLGQLFDPSLSEAATRTLRPDLPPNTIIQIERRGYYWQEKVLRKARVNISKQG